eukprot:CAMPEP_0167809850 /NCGR_PEP_ID=MMETSP0111_2-20121227/24039_1 /TAXON_ID=91324 /ORGANISM="Lotharella globosa, Strain CCCM811" /LENGTH=46 /DNA_ID= /DNA_START= /DNA_END= /DNA_ORIENTATION=
MESRFCRLQRRVSPSSTMTPDTVAARKGRLKSSESKSNAPDGVTLV